MGRRFGAELVKRDEQAKLDAQLIVKMEYADPK